MFAGFIDLGELKIAQALSTVRCGQADGGELGEVSLWRGRGPVVADVDVLGGDVSQIEAVARSDRRHQLAGLGSAQPAENRSRVDGVREVVPWREITSPFGSQP